MFLGSSYLPPEHKNWQGRNESPANAYFFQIIRLLDLTHSQPHLPTANNHELNFVLIGFCCDEGIKRNLGRPGAAKGPDVVRKILAKLAVQRQNFHCYDAGNIICADQNLEEAQAKLGETITLLLKNKTIPIVIGGGHELAWGSYQGIAQQFPHENLGIINFDAHFDMRPLVENQGNSGTAFLQIALDHSVNQRRFDYNCIGIQPCANTKSLFATAKKYNTRFLLADELYNQLYSPIQFLDRIIQENEILYLSLCLDVLAAAFAPGVSAPQTLGLTPWQILPLIRRAASSGKVISYDIAELSPPLDQDDRTAKLAASFIYEIIHHQEISA